MSVRLEPISKCSHKFYHKNLMHEISRKDWSQAVLHTHLRLDLKRDVVWEAVDQLYLAEERYQF